MLQLLFVMASAWAASVPADIPNPRLQNHWVSDTAGVISAEAEERMNARLDALAQDLQVEVAVVTVTDVATTPKEFTTELFNLWGVGNKQTNSGLLVVLAMEQRRLEMETGYGLEARLPDGWLGTMQSREMVPHFKRGEHGAGLEAGVAAVDARLRRGGAVTDASVPPPARQDGLISKDSLFWSMFCVVPLSVVLVPFFVFWYHRRKQRTCEKCKGEMVLLSEVEDDAHLSEGQRVEEELGSVDWLVRVCAACGYVRIRSSEKRGFVRCGGCANRTATQESVTVEAATYSSPGAGRLTVTCSHCGYANTSTFVIAQLQKVSVSSHDSDWTSYGGSSSSYSSGGSDFGGGSSGGGGAGSSW